MAAGAAALLGSGTQLCRLADVERLSAQLSSTPSRLAPGQAAPG